MSAEDSPDSEEKLANLYNQLCARAAGTALAGRNKFIDDEIQKLPVSKVLKDALQNLVALKGTTVEESIEAMEKRLGFAFGIAFVVVILVLAIFIPNPTAFQYLVFRVVLALAAAGVGGVLSGFLTVVFGNSTKTWLQAGGGLAVFAVVYLVNPARLVVEAATNH